MRSNKKAVKKVVGQQAAQELTPPKVKYPTVKQHWTKWEKEIRDWELANGYR